MNIAAFISKPNSAYNQILLFVSFDWFLGVESVNHTLDYVGPMSFPVNANEPTFSLLNRALCFNDIPFRDPSYHAIPLAYHLHAIKDNRFVDFTRSNSTLDD